MLSGRREHARPLSGRSGEEVRIVPFQKEAHAQLSAAVLSRSKRSHSDRTASSVLSRISCSQTLWCDCARAARRVWVSDGYDGEGCGWTTTPHSGVMDPQRQTPVSGNVRVPHHSSSSEIILLLDWRLCLGLASQFSKCISIHRSVHVTTT